MSYPVVIQGGMGAGVSDWFLANTVASKGFLGVVSGTALDVILARRLQMGDPGEHMRRALSNFPFPEIAKKIVDKFFIKDGKSLKERFRKHILFTKNPSTELEELTVAANFVEVFLAKEGHSGPVGINYLEKIQMPNLSSFYGAILAGVDYVLMGAGIPREVPGILDRLSENKEVSMRLHVDGASSDDNFNVHFNPATISKDNPPKLKRPRFLAIIASTVLATTLVKKSNGIVDGFIVEGYSAGGHNAPPRGELKLSEKGEPIYGDKDEVDLGKVASLGLPFWLAGSYADTEGVERAVGQGAYGIQVGTPFAFCNESALTEEIKKYVITNVLKGEIGVLTDPVASPTGFPFKVVNIKNTMSEASVFNSRNRICDLGYLRQPYKREDGEVGYRCPSEPVENYVKKGGDIKDTVGRKCLCNGLMSNIGLPQLQENGFIEKPLVTAGDSIIDIAKYIVEETLSYSVTDILEKFTSIDKPLKQSL